VALAKGSAARGGAGFWKFAGPVPAPLQDYTNYEVALTAKAAESGAALALARSVHR
jgi:hypothetical protein